MSSRLVPLLCVCALAGCGGEPCEQVPVPVEGFVAVQELSTTGRNRGAFELGFAGGVISGTYDATVP